MPTHALSLNAHLRGTQLYALTSAGSLAAACLSLTHHAAGGVVLAATHDHAAAGDDIITARGETFTLLCSPHPLMTGDEFLPHHDAGHARRSEHVLTSEIDVLFRPGTGHGERSDTTSSLRTLSLLLTQSPDGGGVNAAVDGFTFTVSRTYAVVSPDPDAAHQLFLNPQTQAQLRREHLKPFTAELLAPYALVTGEARHTTHCRVPVSS